MAQNPQNMPPYVRFVKRAVEDRSQLTEGGKFGWKDVDFAEITRPGQSDTIEREVEPWLADLESRAQNGYVPLEWFEHFTKMYAAWRAGNELPENGTPIKMWPVVSPAQVEHLLHLQIRTVEALAGADATAVQRIGMGGVELQKRAQAWLEAAEAQGIPAAKLEALSVENADLRRQVDEMRKQLELIAASRQQAKAMA